MNPRAARKRAKRSTRVWKRAVRSICLVVPHKFIGNLISRVSPSERGSPAARRYVRRLAAAITPELSRNYGARPTRSSGTGDNRTGIIEREDYICIGNAGISW